MARVALSGALLLAACGDVGGSGAESERVVSSASSSIEQVRGARLGDQTLAGLEERPVAEVLWTLRTEYRVRARSKGLVVVVEDGVAERAVIAVRFDRVGDVYIGEYAKRVDPTTTTTRQSTATTCEATTATDAPPSTDTSIPVWPTETTHIGPPTRCQPSEPPCAGP